MSPMAVRRVLCRGPEETKALGCRLGLAAQAGDVISLSGELGAGKTCLVQGIAAGLGVSGGLAVTSPTFAILHELPGRLVLYHMDFYRLDGPQIEELGFEEQLEGTGVSVAEWAERWPAYLELANLKIRIDGSGEERLVHLESHELRFLEAAGNGETC